MLAANPAATPPANPPESAWLEWEAPLACPDLRWVGGRVEAYLGRPLSSGERADAGRRLAGQVRARADGRFELALRTGDPPDQRHRLADHDCRRLAELAASLVAIAIDPLALGEGVVPVVPVEQSEPSHPVAPPAPVLVQRPTSRQADPPPEPEPPPKPDEPKPEPKPPADEAPVAWELRVATEADERDRPRLGSGRLRAVALADVGVALGVLPRVAPLAHGGLGLERAGVEARRGSGAQLGLRVELEGGVALAGQFRAPTTTEIGGDLLGWDILLRPCLVPRWGRVDLRACASVGAGQLRGRGVGVQDPQREAQPWVWAGAELGLAGALQRRNPASGATRRVSAALVLDLGGGVNGLRPSFVVLGQSGAPLASYVVPLAWARGRLGVELRFF